MVMNSLKRAMQRIKSVTLGVLWCVSPLVGAAELQPFSAEYTAFKHNKNLGRASLSLVELTDDQFQLTFDSKVSLFLVSDKRHEVSTFSYQNGAITPEKYAFKRTGFGKNRHLNARFDADDKSIEIGDKGTLPWTDEFDNQLYRLDLQLKLDSGQKQYEYNLINYRGEKRHYSLRVLGKEQLSLPYGMLEGLKVKIMRENKKRETFAWFAPSLNYQLVRLQQFKEGKEQGDLQLSAFRTDADSAIASSH